MDHTAAHHLNPTALFADAAALSLAKSATDCDFAAWFREREKARVKAGSCLIAEKLAGKEIECALKVGKRDVDVHSQALDLVKNRRVCGIRIVTPVTFAGNDDIERRSVRLHGANLDGRRMRPENRLMVNVKSIPIVPRRVAFG